MASAQFGRRVVSQVVSSASLRAVCRTSTKSRTAIRRGMASDAHGSTKAKSDMPWMIGSGAVTALGVAYLLTPPSKKAAHAAAVVAHPQESAHSPASSEGAAIRGEHFTGITKAKTQEGADEAKVAEPMTDDEGNEATGQDVGASMEKGFDADAPKDAKKFEEDGSKFDDGAPGQTSAVHDDGDKPEQNEKPTKRSGTLQEEGEDGATDMGAARKSAVEKNAPKESA